MTARLSLDELGCFLREAVSNPLALLPLLVAGELPLLGELALRHAVSAAEHAAGQSKPVCAAAR
ncbi:MULTISPECIES: hypothetical protein [unclassified Streptomyces]|uniref:hypothetical protein n=1 Tax=unclassified Streptomyces TaxID=2593676 RepID=UPI000DC772F3|nr:MULTISPECIES: hypothetical protein [unclassified Streptomyces]AWZ07116.1 hypothetical protein DRB89_23615 [Streptomyces sp. ICC4]AWZ14877.1 hypothetical protein DRB96_24395 [Streptomyces sp. ICC1]